MAIWADISHLESPSDEDDNIIESGWPIITSTLDPSYEALTQDTYSYQHQHTKTLPDQEKTCPVDGFDSSAPEDSVNAEQSTSPSEEQDCHSSGNMPRPKNAVKIPKSRTPSYQRETYRDQKPDHLSTHGIMFSITCPDNITVTVSSNYDEETPLLHTSDTEAAHNFLTYIVSGSDGEFESVCPQADLPGIDIGLEEIDEFQEVIMGLGIETGDISRHRVPTRAFVVTTEKDEDLIFSNVDQEQFDCLLARTRDICTDATSADGILESEGDDEYWVEFTYRECSLWDIIELSNAAGVNDVTVDDETSEPLPIQNNTEDLDAYNSSKTTTQHDLSDSKLVTSPLVHNLPFNPSPDNFEFEFEIDYPLSHFQPLLIGPFNPEPQSPLHPTSTKGHHHPFPSLTHNPSTGAINVTHIVNEHWDCPVFQLTRYVAVASRGPVPLLRRVHELQGLIEEDRRGLREYRQFRREWEVRGSPLGREVSFDETVEVNGEGEEDGSEGN